ncbi:uncharacterized protein LOC121972279 [Zingiber officinale]|uniref:uncharacterized protein LOC121972279 n=1 Tax=Zingiber officinale TaxID=94328 RepID=UPI001C4DADE4|nr:uncharacterized protein LOC121972279 [Zingiber officinale]
MVQQNQFGGGPHDDPDHHLELFYEICGTMKVNGVPPKSVRLLLFGFSLKDRAKQWLNSLPANSITSWEQFKSMLRQCPHHGLEKWLVLHTFYNRINYHTKVSINSTAGGALINKSLDETEEIIENVPQNHHQWASERSGGSFSGNPIKVLGKFDIDAVTLMSAKLDALTKKFQAMGNNNTANVIVCVCETCGSMNHAKDTCPLGTIQAQIYQLEQCNAIVSYNQR